MRPFWGGGSGGPDSRPNNRKGIYCSLLILNNPYLWKCKQFCILALRYSSALNPDLRPLIDIQAFIVDPAYPPHDAIGAQAHHPRLPEHRPGQHHRHGHHDPLSRGHLPRPEGRRTREADSQRVLVSDREPARGPEGRLRPGGSEGLGELRTAAV